MQLVRREDRRKMKKQNSNREIIVLTYAFAIIFLALLIYFGYFVQIKSGDIINNPYNKRQDLLAERVERGKILAAGGEILAETKTNADGEEYRYYPYSNMFCHVVGRFSHGKSGIELSQNINLLTSSENPIIAMVNELQGKKNKGDNVVTTLDLKLQKTAYEALGNRKGAVVVIEPSTGKILAMVSKSDYDPNTVDKNWEQLVEDKDGNSALLNRASQGLYPPGSTFKMVTALEYIHENKNYKSYEYECAGSDNFGEIKINCYHGKVHGTQDLKESFANSCNTSFANLAKDFDLKSYHKLCNKLLFNKKLPTDIPSTKSSFTLGEDTDRSLLPQTAIGQGDTQISPLHNAMITAAVANGGILMRPYVVDHLEAYDGTVVKKYGAEEYGKLMSKKDAKILRTLMKEVVASGTASSLKSSKYTSAGKTGSAEYDSNKSSHAWFTGYAPVKNPEIAISVIVEGAGTGSEYAVPIAKKVMDAYFE